MKPLDHIRGGAPVLLEHVGFAYRGGAAMHFDLAVEAGEIVAVMGPSGSGKSTLLNLIAGFETPASGRILIGGEDVTRLAPAARPVSMVFQENNLFAHLTVADNVGLGRSPALRLDAKDRQAIARAIEHTGLAGKDGRLPHELSGGERQRVALARVLVRRRPLLLLDEPFASLGPALRDEMLDLIATLHTEHAMTVIMATHDPHDAARLSRRLAYIEDGKVAAFAATRDFIEGKAPSAFARYMGERFPASGRHMTARKPP